MSLKRLVLSASVLTLGVAGTFVALQAWQGPLYDKVIVDLPYRVTVNDKALEPGNYTIQELPSANKSRVLLIYSNNGMKFETSAMTIPTLDNRTPEDTKVVLHHYTNDYYFDKIWIQGKNYGYEFPLPDSVKSRERERMTPMTVAAKAETAPAPSTDQSAGASTTAQSTTAQSTTADTTAQNTTANTTGQSTTDQNAAANTAAQNTTAATPAQTATDQNAAANATAGSTTPSTTSQSTTTGGQSAAAAPADTGTATAAADQNANAGAATDTGAGHRRGRRGRRLPSTSANWLAMLLSGGFLSAAGLALRRSR